MIAAMDTNSASARAAETGAERRAFRRAFVLCLAIVAVIYVVNSLSVTTEMARTGQDRGPAYAWALEGTAVTAMLLALPFVLWLGTVFPFERGRWGRALAIHLAGVLVYGAVQVALMSALRGAVWPVLYDRPFVYGDSLAGTFVYEFRKQAAAYLGFQLILATSRSIERLRLEAAAARTEARTSHRITLKSGGRSFYPDAADFLSAKAAGNYVEARFGARDILARMTLNELQTLLTEAGVDAVRTHRSFLVNRAAIAETTPTGEGDLRIVLKDGSELPGSRRYREGLRA